MDTQSVIDQGRCSCIWRKEEKTAKGERRTKRPWGYRTGTATPAPYDVDWPADGPSQF